MRQVHLQDPSALRHAWDVFQGASPVVMLQLPSVFALIAPPTRRGAAALDEAKQRLPGKTYGSLIGELEAFHALARPLELPPELRPAGALRCFEGAFMRIAIGPSEASSPMVRHGTHQGLLMTGPHRAFFRALELRLRAQAEPELFCGRTYAAPLGTSANRSGDPLGSITTWERAEEFARSRRIGLVIRSTPDPDAQGSFPIFRLRLERVSLERAGPYDRQIQARLPAHLREP